MFKKNNMKKFSILCLLVLFVACKKDEKKNEAIDKVTKKEIKSVPEFTKDIELAHNKADFISKDIISYNLVVEFGGKEYLSAKFTQTVSGSMIKMEKTSGEIVIFDGNEVYTNLSDANLATDRFDIFTWPYFITLPYKLNDEGTIWSDFQNKTFNGQNVPTGKLSFKPNTGDAPDDWYVIYKDPTKGFLVGAAYIVSFGKGKEAAEKEPHAVKYTNFTAVDGISFPIDLTYHMWTTENGFGNQIGKAKLTNVAFLKSNDSIFRKSEKTLLVPLK